MPYSKPAPLVPVRSIQRFERAMQDRDFNCSELARVAGTGHMNVSNIRNGRVKRVRRDTAVALERSLKVEPGTLFEYNETRAQTEPVG